MNGVYKITSFRHLLYCFFLVFALFLSYLARFGFPFRDLLVVLVQLQSGDSHLAGVDAHRTVVPLAFSRGTPSSDDTFLPVSLDRFASLLPFVLSSHILSFIILSDGHGSNPVLLCQFFGKKRRHIFLQMWGSALKCLLWFLLWSEVTKGLSSILIAGASAVVV